MTLRSNLNSHLGEASSLRRSILLVQFLRRSFGPRLVSCVFAHDLLHLKMRTFPLDFLYRCSSRLSPASSRVILDLSVFLSSSLPLLAFFCFLLIVDLLFFAPLAWQLLSTMCWAIAIATTRARGRWSLPRAIACASRSIEQMSHITLSVFSTMSSTNEWRDAVASDLMTSFAKA